MMRAHGGLLPLMLVLVLHVGALGAEAQAKRPARIGVLSEAWGTTPQIIGLRDGLKELGQREEIDFTLGVRFTQGDPGELSKAAGDLVRLGVDLIVAGETTNTAEAARQVTDRIPIVFIGGSDPVAFGLVKSLAQPGGNVTGIADLDIELVPKRMEIFREIVPGLKRVVFVYDGASRHAASVVKVHREAAQRLGLTLVERPVRSTEEARAAVNSVRKDSGDGVFSPRLLSLNIPGVVLDAAINGTAPTMFYSAYFTERGGLASYAASQYELGHGAATLVDRILKGAKPADLPVRQPTKFELVINLKAARGLGLAIPPSLRLRADRIIE